MPPIPDVDVRVTDGALGFVPTDAQTTTAKIGVATGGVPNTVYAFTEKETLRATLLGGPVVEAAADTLDDSGGTVLIVPVNPSVPGSAGPVSHKGTGLATMSVTGAPKDATQVIVEILQPGVLSKASFRVSIDAGNNFSPETAMPLSGSYPLLDTGLTLVFSTVPGLFIAGDTYALNCTAPAYTATDAFAAFTALLADARRWKLVHVVGTPGGVDDTAKATASAALAAAIGSKMAEAGTAHRYARALLEAPDVADAALVAAFLMFVDPRIAVAGGFIDHLSALSGRIFKRPAAWAVATRVAKIPISQDAAWVGAPQGPLPASVRKLYRDERKTPALDAARFITLRTIVGRTGFYITNPWTMALATSDYALLQNGLVIDEACSASYDAMVEYLSATLTVDAKTGRIDEIDAVAAESKVFSRVGAAVLQPGHVSLLLVRINRTDNLLSTRKLRWKVRAIPHAYPKSIEVEIGFLNPALTVLPTAA